MRTLSILLGENPRGWGGLGNFPAASFPLTLPAPARSHHARDARYVLAREEQVSTRQARKPLTSLT
jgi:hypothetical protein